MTCDAEEPPLLLFLTYKFSVLPYVRFLGYKEESLALIPVEIRPISCFLLNAIWYLTNIAP
jgi:hypothetical protein